MNKFLFFLCMPGLLFGVSACNGILSDIYDTPSEQFVASHGFVSHDETTGRGPLKMPPACRSFVLPALGDVFP